VKATARDKHRTTKADDDSAASKRLSDVEIQVQAMRMKSQDDIELVARISGTEHQLQVLQANSQEQQFKCLQKVHDRQCKLSENLDVVNEWCSRLERNQDMLKTQFHRMIIPNFSQPAAVSADSSSQHSMQTNARLVRIVNGRSLPVIQSPRQELLFRHPSMQSLPAQRPLQLQAKPQCQPWTHRPCVSQQRQASRRGPDVALSRATEQATVLCAQQHTATSAPCTHRMTTTVNSKCGSPSIYSRVVTTEDACTTVNQWQGLRQR